MYVFLKDWQKLKIKTIEDLKIVTCHLGQGASVCAIEGGKSVDTSMGLNTFWRSSYGNKKWEI